MVIDHYSQLLYNFRNLLLTTVEPIERVAALPKEGYQYFQQDFQSIEELKKKNHQLETENLLLKAEQLQLDKLKLEVKRLNRLLGTASQMSSTDIQIATIKRYSRSPYAQFFTLDKGSFDDIQATQAVIDTKGLIGLITQVTPVSSRVQLITDLDSQIPVRVRRTGQRGILTGLGHNQLSLQFIPNTSSIIVGDLIETSGLGDVYPKGYPVAVISSVKNLKDQPYYAIMADPIAELNQAEKVLVLSTQKPNKLDLQLETDVQTTIKQLEPTDE